jgi:hypothetical protein
MVEVSHELVDHLTAHDITVPGNEEDEQDVRFILCQYKHLKGPQHRPGDYKHRISRDEKASTSDWSLRALRQRNPDLKHRGLPVVFLGPSHSGHHV